LKDANHTLTGTATIRQLKIVIISSISLGKHCARAEEESDYYLVVKVPPSIIYRPLFPRNYLVRLQVRSWSLKASIPLLQNKKGTKSTIQAWRVKPETSLCFSLPFVLLSAFNGRYWRWRSWIWRSNFMPTFSCSRWGFRALQGIIYTHTHDTQTLSFKWITVQVFVCLYSLGS